MQRCGIMFISVCKLMQSKIHYAVDYWKSNIDFAAASLRQTRLSEWSKIRQICDEIYAK